MKIVIDIPEGLKNKIDNAKAGARIRMPNSLRSKLSKLRYKRQISDEEYRELISKLEGHDKELLDKIIAEILEEKECAYADFERYKVEYLGQDWEDALDSLPQDDFRYGMERAVEIIDKYKAEQGRK